jgi:salicylate hydroxylase
VVYEAPQLGEIGAGVQISANGTRWGSRARLPNERCAPQAKEIGHRKSGRSSGFFDLGVASDAHYGAPYIFIHRADLQRILANAVLALSDAVHLDPGCVVSRMPMA